MLPRPAEPVEWRHLADQQDGIVCRAQLLGIGLSSAQARGNVDNGRWRRLWPGVYATFTGPVGPRAGVWAAVLYAGPGAAASHRTALWLAGLFDEHTAPVHISVPAARRVTAQPGIRVHLRRALGNDGRPITHPSAAPPRIRLEVSLLDQCETETREGTTHLVLRAIQRRLTTADRLRSALRARPRHRWRGLVSDILAETAAGVASPLELHYRRGVELRHRLPPGIRNAQDIAPGGGHWYRDVHYRRWRVIVELDGREAHPIDAAFRDLRRDNLAAVAGETVLRYGWRDVIGNPCNVAAQVASVLAARGWTGQSAPCHERCPVRTVRAGGTTDAS